MWLSSVVSRPGYLTEHAAGQIGATRSISCLVTKRDTTILFCAFAFLKIWAQSYSFFCNKSPYWVQHVPAWWPAFDTSVAPFPLSCECLVSSCGDVCSLLFIRLGDRGGYAPRSKLLLCSWFLFCWSRTQLISQAVQRFCRRIVSAGVLLQPTLTPDTNCV